MKPIIIANWKMNPVSLRQAKALFSGAERAARQGKVQVVVCPPYPFLVPLGQMQKKTVLGAQNCSWKTEGALTGEVSPVQLRNLGCKYVILGHSERKKYLAERLQMIQKKVEAALKAGLGVILCVENVTELRAIKKRIRQFKNVVVVFEPSSAISTEGGKRIAPEDIAMMTIEMRKIVGRNVPVLYGGSVGVNTIAAIMKKGRVRGVLVGVASLHAGEFTRLVKNAL